MRNCQHLDVPPSTELIPDTESASVAFCILKTDTETCLNMAFDASQALEQDCSPNNECHYYPSDRCEGCPSYST